MSAANVAWTLSRDAAGRLVFTDEQAAAHTGVEPVRAFPLSDPERWISLLDQHGHELAAIPDLAHLPGDLRQLILNELADREFLPRIERVVRVIDDRDPEQWHVETDRGPVHFLLRNSDDVRRVAPFCAILVDMHGVRFYVPDSRKLDKASQRIMSRYL